MIHFFIIVVAIVLFVVIMATLKAKNTTYKYTTVFTLKDESPNIKKKFNLIGDIPGLMVDEVFIQQTDKIVYGKIVKTSFKIVQYNYEDNDDDDFCD